MADSRYLCDYKPASQLGVGAYGEVFKGYDKNDGCLVAVKRFKKIITDRERDILKSISHKNIVSIIDVIEEKHMKTRVIMEYCDLGSMLDHLYKPRHRYGMEERHLFDFLKQFSDGLQFLIKQSVVHRDIKPGNIMRCGNSDGSVMYKITDFGVSKVLDNLEDSMTSFDAGTPSYAHPKILLRKKYHAEEADLWSTGVTIYQMVTGNIPFDPKQVPVHQIFDKPDKVIAITSTDGRSSDYSSVLPKDCKISSPSVRKAIVEILQLLFNIRSPPSFEAYFKIIKSEAERERDTRLTLYVADPAKIGDKLKKVASNHNLAFDTNILPLSIEELSMDCLETRAVCYDPYSDPRYDNEKSLCYKLIRQCQRLQEHLSNARRLVDMFNSKYQSKLDKAVIQTELLTKLFASFKAVTVLSPDQYDILEFLNKERPLLKQPMQPFDIRGFNKHVSDVSNGLERISIQCEMLFEELDAVKVHANMEGKHPDSLTHLTVLDLRCVYLRSFEKELNDLKEHSVVVDLNKGLVFLEFLEEAPVVYTVEEEGFLDELQDLLKSISQRPYSREISKDEELVAVAEENQRLIDQHKLLFSTLMRNYDPKNQGST